jgi:sterol 3beta-glucosyltransferase
MQVTGYLPLHEDLAGWKPGADLADFLDAGPAPVYIGFGSLCPFLGPRGDRLARAIVDGCQQAGVRAIVQASDLAPRWASPRLFVLQEAVPHGWLFPRCAAIVHHGGYGTVHAALVARRPMIIYPFQTDEFLWAARMRDLGIGPGFTARLRDLSAPRLARDLAVVLQGDSQQHADRVGRAVAAEQGLSTQVESIASIIDHTRRGGRPTDWAPAVPAVPAVAHV